MVRSREEAEEGDEKKVLRCMHGHQKNSALPTAFRPAICTRHDRTFRWIGMFSGVFILRNSIITVINLSDLSQVRLKVIKARQALQFSVFVKIRMLFRTTGSWVKYLYEFKHACVVIKLWRSGEGLQSSSIFEWSVVFLHDPGGIHHHALQRRLLAQVALHLLPE